MKTRSGLFALSVDMPTYTQEDEELEPLVHLFFEELYHELVGDHQPVSTDIRWLSRLQVDKEASSLTSRRTQGTSEAAGSVTAHVSDHKQEGQHAVSTVSVGPCSRSSDADLRMGTRASKGKGKSNPNPKNTDIDIVTPSSARRASSSSTFPAAEESCIDVTATPSPHLTGKSKRDRVMTKDDKPSSPPLSILSVSSPGTGFSSTPTPVLVTSPSTSKPSRQPAKPSGQPASPQGQTVQVAAADGPVKTPGVRGPGPSPSGGPGPRLLEARAQRERRKAAAAASLGAADKEAAATEAAAKAGPGKLSSQKRVTADEGSAKEGESSLGKGEGEAAEGLRGGKDAMGIAPPVRGGTIEGKGSRASTRVPPGGQKMDAGSDYLGPDLKAGGGGKRGPGVFGGEAVVKGVFESICKSGRARDQGGGAGGAKELVKIPVRVITQGASKKGQDQDSRIKRNRDTGEQGVSKDSSGRAKRVITTKGGMVKKGQDRGGGEVNSNGEQQGHSRVRDRSRGSGSREKKEPVRKWGVKDKGSQNGKDRDQAQDGVKARDKGGVKPRANGGPRGAPEPTGVTKPADAVPSAKGKKRGRVEGGVRSPIVPDLRPPEGPDLRPPERVERGNAKGEGSPRGKGGDKPWGDINLRSKRNAPIAKGSAMVSPELFKGVLPGDTATTSKRKRRGR
ncbi:unnamed protein product, partial [Discosporangium mesarthrocarpum]